jgi:hypothetical protein
MFLNKIKNALFKMHHALEKHDNTPACSIWQDTGKVYYLENTLKLAYQSNSGLFTLEN